MEHGITLTTIGNWPFIAISADEFRRIKDAKQKLLVTLGIEEKFELFIENYAEYERDVVQIAQRQMLRGIEPWAAAMDALLLLNRRLSNALTAATVYRDQVHHDVGIALGGGSAKTGEVLKAFSREYDGDLGYRVMEKLRNHAQHQSLPIRSLRCGPEKVQVNGRAFVRFTAIPQLDLSALRDEKFKSVVLTEMGQVKTGKNVTGFLRGYVRGLGRVHSDIRRLTACELKEWRSDLCRVITVGREEIHCVLGLAVVARDEEGNCPEVIDIFEDCIQRLDALRSRYLHLDSLPDWFVSTEAV